MPDEQSGPPAEAAPPSNATPNAPRPTVDQRLATLTTRGTFLGFQMVATLVAVIGGVLFFELLLASQLNSVLAAGAGLVFALAARRAFTWLLVYVLTARAPRGGPPA
ncbi:MAG TPA: hypothetical protein VGR57_21280 [Ktedonobacterales bacterium]|nr:hypothetical protein [Ktedonobacterales bacterium]